MSNSNKTRIIDSFEKKSFTDKIISEINDFDIIETISSSKANSNNFSSILDKKVDENMDDVATTITNVLANNEINENLSTEVDNNTLPIGRKISDIISDNLRDNETNNINIVANYLPKRKVREMLFAKYKIDNDEYVNEIYNMAFNRRWKELDLEQWLNNPNNVNKLFGSIKSQANLKDKELAQKRNGLIQKHQVNKASSLDDKSKNGSNHKNDIDEDDYSYIKYNNQINNPFRKDIMAHNLVGDKHLLNCVDFGFVRDGIYTNKMDNKILEVKIDNLKNEMKYAYIEEKLKENQFDLQTEKLKSHIDNKFGELFKDYSNDNQWQKNNYYNSYDNRFDRYGNYSTINNTVSELKDDILGKISLLHDKISSIEIAYKSNANSFNTNNNQIFDKVSNQIKYAFDEFDKRESLINNHLDETNDKLNEVNEKIENTVDVIDEKISDAVNEKIDQSLSNLKNQINETSDNVKTFLNDLDNLKSFVYGNEGFDGSINAIGDNQVANIMNQINDSNKHMNKISNELNELKSLINGSNFDKKFNENQSNNSSFQNYLNNSSNSLGGFHKNNFIDDTKFDNNNIETQFRDRPILVENKQDELPNFDEIDNLIKQSIEQIKSLNEIVQLDAKENDQVEINDSISKLESIKESR